MFSNEDDDCMTFSLLFDPFLKVVGKHTCIKVSVTNKYNNNMKHILIEMNKTCCRITTDCFSISKLDSSYRNILKLNVLCVYSI